MILNTLIPDFTLPTSQNGQFTLSAQRGKLLVIYFYPKDDTPGCTIENQDFSAHQALFASLNCVLVGVSRDTVRSHDKFCLKYQLHIPLLADTDETVCNLFDVIKPKNMYGKQVRGIERSTFVLNREGILVREWRKVKIESHVVEVLHYVKNL